MSAIAVLLLFGFALTASAWTLFASVRPQLHRFTELVRPAIVVPVLPPRLTRVTVRSAPARMPARLPRRAAA